MANKGRVLIDKNDIVGKYFGKLKVLKYDHYYYDISSSGRWMRHYYECECQACGSVNVFPRVYLMKGLLQHCGCLKHEGRPKGTNRKFYIVYRKKDDTIAAVGTSSECAKQLGHSLSSFYSLVSRAKNNKSCRYEVEISEEDDEEYGDTNEE